MITDKETWPRTINEQRWHRSDFAGPPPPVLHPEAGWAPVELPPVDFSPMPTPALAQEHPTNVHLPGNRISGHHRSLHERFSQPDLAQIPQSSDTFFDPPRVPPRFGNFSHDFRHRTVPLPHRRPPYWVDDPYQGPSWRDPLLRPYPPRYECCSRLGHYCAPLCTPGYLNHCHHSHVEATSQAQQHCTYHGSLCPSSRLSTLTYIGPPNPPSCHNCASPQTGAASSPQENTDTAGKRGGDCDQQESSDSKISAARKKSLGPAMKRWLNKCLSVTKSLALISPKLSNNEQAGDVTPQSAQAKEPNIRVTDARRVSSSSALSTGASKFQALTPASETVLASTSSPLPQLFTLPSDCHRASQESPLILPEAVQPILRSASTVSTCLCLPKSVELHSVLRHNPFDKSTIYWNIMLSPGMIYEPDMKSSFLRDVATNPPVRHMFINGIGDFPLEKCQGDPDPSRSKNREWHMYPTGNGDGLVEKRTLPWPIRITGTGNSGFITLEDVFRAIHLNFQEYITHEEYDLYTIQRKRLITAAYHLRQKALEETRKWPQGPVPVGFVRPVFVEDLVEDGIMRCDYLGSQLMFRGLEISPDEEGYTLFLGPTD